MRSRVRNGLRAAGLLAAAGALCAAVGDPRVGRAVGATGSRTSPRDGRRGRRRRRPGPVRPGHRARRARPGTPSPTTESSADPSAVVPTGLFTLQGRTLDRPTAEVSSTLDATVGPGSTATLDVRGRRPGGGWTEWIPSTPGARDRAPGPPSCPEPVREVQGRLVLTSTGADRAVRARRDAQRRAVQRPRAGSSARAEAAPLSYSVFATREGLVGGTTANGHKIANRDKFVALPSRRALSPNGKSDYSVKVCAPNGRCAFAPVWDIGPWNTKDDYWNPGPQRQQFKDLPQGVPAGTGGVPQRAQRRQGRLRPQARRTRPASTSATAIFWDALGLKDNSQVTVDYLWTGNVRLSKVSTNGAPDTPLRAAPDANAQVVGVAADTSGRARPVPPGFRPRTGGSGSGTASTSRRRRSRAPPTPRPVRRPRRAGRPTPRPFPPSPRRATRIRRARPRARPPRPTPAPRPRPPRLRPRLRPPPPPRPPWRPAPTRPPVRRGRPPGPGPAADARPADPATRTTTANAHHRGERAHPDARVSGPGARSPVLRASRGSRPTGNRSGAATALPLCRTRRAPVGQGENAHRRGERAPVWRTLTTRHARSPNHRAFRGSARVPRDHGRRAGRRGTGSRPATVHPVSRPDPRGTRVSRLPRRTRVQPRADTGSARTDRNSASTGPGRSSREGATFRTAGPATPPGRATPRGSPNARNRGGRAPNRGTLATDRARPPNLRAFRGSPSVAGPGRSWADRFAGWPPWRSGSRAPARAPCRPRSPRAGRHRGGDRRRRVAPGARAAGAARRRRAGDRRQLRQRLLRRHPRHRRRRASARCGWSARSAARAGHGARGRVRLLRRRRRSPGSTLVSLSGQWWLIAVGAVVHRRRPGSTPAAGGPTATPGSARSRCSSSSGRWPCSAPTLTQSGAAGRAGAWSPRSAVGHAGLRGAGGQQPARHPRRRASSASARSPCCSATPTPAGSTPRWCRCRSLLSALAGAAQLAAAARRCSRCRWRVLPARRGAGRGRRPRADPRARARPGCCCWPGQSLTAVGLGCSAASSDAGSDGGPGASAAHGVGRAVVARSRSQRVRRRRRSAPARASSRARSPRNSTIDSGSATISADQHRDQQRHPGHDQQHRR